MMGQTFDLGKHLNRPHSQGAPSRKTESPLTWDNRFSMSHA